MTDNREIWLEKYRPTTFKEYLNYKKYKSLVNEWINPFINSKTANNVTNKPFLILYGPPSYGKTTLAHCIFNEYGFEPLECNASDTRNKSQLEKRIKTGKYSFEMKEDGSGFKPYGLILDELDGLTTGDNGGVDTIMKIVFLSDNKLVKNNEYKVRYPVICTTNSIKEKKLLPILKFGELITMDRPSKQALFELGKKIIKQENIPITQKLLKDYISEEDDYRLLINKLTSLYFDIKNIPKLTDKKKRIIEIVNNSITKTIQLKINNKSIHDITYELMVNLQKYDKNQILRVIDSNNLLFYFTMITNYTLFTDIKLNINQYLIDELINNFYIGNNFLEFLKKNKNDNYELIKYINYIVSYGMIYLVNDKFYKPGKGLSTVVKGLKYHTKYNDMKQDKSYFFSNIQYKFNISGNLSTDIKKKVLIKKKIIGNSKKNGIDNNDNIFNDIIDLDILFMYNKLSYSNNETGLNKTIYTKMNKYYS